MPFLYPEFSLILNLFNALVEILFVQLHMYNSEYFGFCHKHILLNQKKRCHNVA